MRSLGVGFCLRTEMGKGCRVDAGEGIHREDPFRPALYTMRVRRSKAKIKPFIFSRYFNLMIETEEDFLGRCIGEFS